MRFRTRAFLLCFVPFALLMAGSFWAIQTLVQSTVREGLVSSLRENHGSIARLRARSDLQNSRFLKVAAENAGLKAGLQLLLSYPGNAAARQTVEDQLRELCEQMGFDFLLAADSAGRPLAAVVRVGKELSAVASLPLRAPPAGLMMRGDQLYQIAPAPIDQNEDNIGELAVGELFSLSDFSTPAVLMREGSIVQSSLPNISARELESALKGCNREHECDLRLAGERYISLPLQGISPGGPYVLRSMQSVDTASRPVQAVLNRIFWTASAGVALAALFFSLISSRSIVKPIAAMISHLRESESTGLLPEFETDLSPIHEIRDLTYSFNRVAGTIREARQRLQTAYVEFVGSLASALDARDHYTAGHSRRVSELACATATALGATTEELDEIRIGALLHDIGKIGIADKFLQKPGKLTVEEFDAIKQHPEIGRRILEGVQGFTPYLDAVELHHENWDGSGYPRGQAGESTPLSARIIHVSDAFDAMTTDRPYRRGMSRDKALATLRQFAGTQFDPRVVEVFARLASVHRESAVDLEYAGVRE